MSAKIIIGQNYATKFYAIQYLGPFYWLVKVIIAALNNMAVVIHLVVPLLGHYTVGSALGLAVTLLIIPPG